ncbi:MAG TPA: response regulator [Allocoleopsis sp.]
MENILNIDDIPCIIISINENSTITYSNVFGKMNGFNVGEEVIISSNSTFDVILEAWETIIKISSGKQLKALVTKLNNVLIIHDISTCHEKRNNFLANLAHEIRTPLNGIIGMISLLLDTRLDLNQKKFVSMLNDSSCNLIKIVNDILDFSKLESGKLIILKKPFSIKECIEGAHDVVLTKAKNKNTEMNISMDPRVPEYVTGDCQRLRQILINLYSNSLKFIPQGNGKILTSVNVTTNTSSNNQEQNILFSIKDNGKGIKKEEQILLFRAYTQLFNDYTQKFSEGTGLGLSICKELCHLMGGKIWLNNSVYSEDFIGSGTEFCFTIKVQTSKNNEPDLDTSILDNKKILVVDDNYTNRIGLCNILMKKKILPFPCSTTDEALLYLSNQTFDIILLDIYMPGISGVELAKKIREKNIFTPLIALSSMGDKIKNIDNNLFDNILVKPIMERKILEVCCNVLSRDEERNENIPEIKILIDEDVYHNQIVLENMLNRMGYNNIHCVSNGKEALAKITKEKFDLCFIDIKTPIMSGMEFIERIKKYKEKPYCVALTAVVLDGESLLRKGFDSYLFKPIEIQKLSEIMGKFQH